MSATGLGHAGSALPGHPGVECVWGPGQRDDEEQCMDVFCPNRRTKRVDPLEAGRAAALDLAVEKHLRGELSAGQLHARIHALNEMETK